MVWHSPSIMIMFYPALWFLPLLTMMGGLRVKVNENVTRIQLYVKIYVWQWKDCNSKVRRAILILGISQWSIKFICAESWILTKKASTTLAKRCTGSPLNNLEKLVCKLERLWGWHQGISSQGCVIRITVLLFSILLLFWLLMWAGFSFL